MLVKKIEFLSALYSSSINNDGPKSKTRTYE